MLVRPLFADPMLGQNPEKQMWLWLVNHPIYSHNFQNVLGYFDYPYKIEDISKIQTMCSKQDM